MLHITRRSFALTILMSTCLNHAMTSKQLSLIHENNNFRIESDEGSFPIQRCYMDKELRGISSDKLAKYVAAGARLQVSKLDGNDHEYTLKLNGKLNGGGVITANIFYWGVKAIGYGTPAAVATVSVVTAAAPLIAAGGTATAAGITATMGASSAIGTTALGAASATAATAGTVIGAGTTIATGTLMAGAGTAVAAGAAAGEALIATVGLNTAAVGTAGALGAGGATATYVAGVEAVATGAFGFGLACWFLP